MELAQGTLFEFLHGDVFSRAGKPTGAQLDWHSRLEIALCCARAVAFLHSQRPSLVHTDIKSLNFLVTGPLEVKLCDFENCVRVGVSFASATGARAYGSMSGGGAAASHTLDSEQLGAAVAAPDTVNWSSPEVAASDSKRGAYSTKSDVYSLGVVLWEVFTGQVPFGKMAQQDIRAVLLRADGGLHHPPLDGLAPPVAALLRDCWALNPDNRLTAHRLVERLSELPRGGPGPL